MFVRLRLRNMGPRPWSASGFGTAGTIKGGALSFVRRHIDPGRRRESIFLPQAQAEALALTKS